MSGPRADIGSALEGRLTPEQLERLLDEVLAITKTGRGWCPDCKKSVMVQVPDAKAVTGALVDLANQAWGRPTESHTEPEGVTFIRKIVYAGERDVDSEPPLAS